MAACVLRNIYIDLDDLAIKYDEVTTITPDIHSDYYEDFDFHRDRRQEVFSRMFTNNSTQVEI